ncbi:MAG TPA: YaaL family protein [Bacillota bacterium]
MLEDLARWWSRTRERWSRVSGRGRRGLEHDGGVDEVDLVDQARREWQAARALFENVSDPELIDHAIHRMTAAERRYMFLIKEARKSGVMEDDLRQLLADPPRARAADHHRPT